MTVPAGASSRLIVLVEDDDSIGGVIRDALSGHGYLVEWCRDGASAISTFEKIEADLVLLDAGLPDIDGFTLCRWLREQDVDVPILLVTARDSEIDIVVGLDSGATDYITKPFSMNVLLARVRAHMRGIDALAPIVVGALTVDPAAYLVTANGNEVPLRRREFELLLALSREAGRVITRERLLSDVWDLHWESSTKTLDMHVLALRRKLGTVIEIATVRGVGYRLVCP